MRGWLLVVLLTSATLVGCTQAEDPLAVSGREDNSALERHDSPAPSSTTPPTGQTSPASPPPPTSRATPPTPSTPPPPPLPPPVVVLALIDDGINPYHAAFRDPSPRALQHPSTYIPGYPADAEPLRLSFAHADLKGALKADCAQWEKVKPGQLYYVPGTRIIGAITLAEQGVEPRPITCAKPVPTGVNDIVGDGGHGTMTASRAAGADYGACPECFIVMAQGFAGPQVAWAASQPWIDLQSNSWAPITPIPAPSVVPFNAASTPALARTIEAAASKQLSFWASGNGAAGRLGVVGHPSQLDPHFTPSVIRVGGLDSGRVAVWPGSGPHVVSDACSSFAAKHETITEWSGTQGSGTSAATPFAAGIAARILLDARTLLGDGGQNAREGALAAGTASVPGDDLSDGRLTRAELLDVFLKTAIARPDATREDGPACDAADVMGPGTGPVYGAPPIAWTQVPDGPAGIPLIGYGAVTRETAMKAGLVLRGTATLPQRADEDQWFAQDKAWRDAAHQAFAQLP